MKCGSKVWGSVIRRYAGSQDNTPGVKGMFDQQLIRRKAVHGLGRPFIHMTKGEQRWIIKVKADLVQGFSGEDIKSAEGRCRVGRGVQQRNGARRHDGRG